MASSRTDQIQPHSPADTRAEFWLHFQSISGRTSGRTATERSVEIAGPYKACGEENSAQKYSVRNF
jgi:hypothetical protein